MNNKLIFNYYIKIEEINCDQRVWVEREIPYSGQDSERWLLKGYWNHENN